MTAKTAAEALFLEMQDNPDKVGQAFDCWLKQTLMDMDPYSDPIQDAHRIASIAFQMGRVAQVTYDEANRTNYDNRSLIK